MSRKQSTGKDVFDGQPAVPLLPYQRGVVESDSRFLWACWARQTGKSFTFSLRRVLRGILRRRTQLFLSAGLRQSRELMIKVQQHCRALQIAARAPDTRGDGGFRYRKMEIILPNGVRLMALPAKPETIRGFTGDVFLDEFAMHADDRAIWAAIFPTVLRGDGELDVASTPKGKDNLFYELQHNEMFERSMVTLPDAVRQGLDVDIESLRRAMGDEELFRQEFLCEFLDESEAFMPHRLISSCEEPELAKEPDWESLCGLKGDVYAGVDVGRVKDLTVVWLWQRLGDGEHWSLRCAGVIEMTAFPFAQQQQMLARILELPCLRRCCIDATGLGWGLAEWAQSRYGRARVEPLHLTVGLKAQMAGQLRVLAEEGRIKIPSDEAIRNDWHSVRRGLTADGSLRLRAQRGSTGHADRFWAAALGAYAAQEGHAGRFEYTSAGKLRFWRDGIW